MLGHPEYRWCVFVMAVALVLSPGDQSAPRASMTLETSFVAAAPIASMKFRVCLGDTANSDAMSGMACLAHCAVPSAIVPVAPALTTIGASCPAPEVTLKTEDYRRPPDPHPPKPIIIG